MTQATCRKCKAEFTYDETKHKKKLRLCDTCYKETQNHRHGRRRRPRDGTPRPVHQTMSQINAEPDNPFELHAEGDIDPLEPETAAEPAPPPPEAAAGPATAPAAGETRERPAPRHFTRLVCPECGAEFELHCKPRPDRAYLCHECYQLKKLEEQF